MWASVFRERLNFGIAERREDMTGTTEQILAAQELIETFDKEMNVYINSLKDKKNKDKWIEIKEKLDEIFSEASAEDVIDLLKRINKNGRNYCIALSFLIRTSRYKSPFIRKIWNDVWENTIPKGYMILDKRSLAQIAAATGMSIRQIQDYYKKYD